MGKHKRIRRARALRECDAHARTGDRLKLPPFRFLCRDGARADPAAPHCSRAAQASALAGKHVRQDIAPPLAGHCKVD